MPKRFGAARTRFAQQMSRLTPRDRDEVERFRGFLADWGSVEGDPLKEDALLQQHYPKEKTDGQDRQR